MAQKMTVEDVKAYARKNYNNGGDQIVECWEDSDIEEFLKTTNDPMKSLNIIFQVRNEEFEAARYFSGYDEEKENEDALSEDGDIEDGDDESEEYYSPSATNRDYSPSNPWDAPGMSIRDFI